MVDPHASLSEDMSPLDAEIGRRVIERLPGKPDSRRLVTPLTARLYRRRPCPRGS
jgi:hypothetical protein